MPPATSTLLPTLAVLAVYVGAMLLVGSCSSRVRFVGSNARVRTGLVWARYYYYAIAASLVMSLLMIVVVQAVTDIDACYADAVAFYNSPSDVSQRDFSFALSRLAVIAMCVEALFLHRNGSFQAGVQSSTTSIQTISREERRRRRRERRRFSRLRRESERGTTNPSGGGGTFSLSWLSVAHVCMLHFGQRVAYFTCIIFRTILNDTKCRPYSLANSISLESSYAVFWLMSAVRLPIALSASADPSLVSSYSPALICLNICRGRVGTAAGIFGLTFSGGLLLMGLNIFYFEIGLGIHTIRQVCYGGVIGAFFHVATSVNIDVLFHPISIGENLPAAATRRRRIRTIVVAASNVLGMYFLSGSLAYRILRDKHQSLMWREVLTIRPAILDLCITILFLYAIVRKGARRTGYIEYSAILPNEHPDHV